MDEKIRAIALLSGGLDSTLAVRLVKDQGVEVVALTFTSPFCTCTSRARRQAGCHNEALRVGRELGVEVKLLAKGKEYLEVLRHPKHGRGRSMNPCIDCRIFMLKKAAALMGSLGASFLITGEVLGQRPMSQHRQAIQLIEREAGLEGKILRPLSALNFDPTEAERSGWVDRQKLLDISGRSRGRQMELADKLGIVDYPCPAGGCLLTDPNFGAKIRDLFEHSEGELDPRELELLKIGRHFRLLTGAKLVLGRNQEENERLELLAPPRYRKLTPLGFMGPSALLAGGDPPDLATAAAVLVHFSHKAPATPRVLATTETGDQEIEPDPAFEIHTIQGCALGVE